MGNGAHGLSGQRAPNQVKRRAFICTLKRLAKIPHGFAGIAVQPTRKASNARRLMTSAKPSFAASAHSVGASFADPYSIMKTGFLSSENARQAAHESYAKHSSARPQSASAAKGEIKSSLPEMPAVMPLRWQASINDRA